METLTPAPLPLRTSAAHPPVLRELWRYRELLRGLVVRNLKVKYQRSALGFAWTLLNPLLTVVILAVVFTRVVRLGIEDYWAFLLSGYFAWNFILQTLNTGTWIFNEHSDLTRSVPFPQEALVMSAALSRLLEFCGELALILIVLFLFRHHGAPASAVLVPLLMVLQLLLVIGLALPIATLSVFYYDVQHALPIALTSLFYASPVFYPASFVPEAFRPFYFINPAAGLLTLWHVVLYEGRMPSWELLGGTAAYSVGLFLLGYAIFNRYKSLFAETV